MIIKHVVKDMRGNGRTWTTFHLYSVDPYVTVAQVADFRSEIFPVVLQDT